MATVLDFTLFVTDSFTKVIAHEIYHILHPPSCIFILAGPENLKDIYIYIYLITKCYFTVGNQVYKQDIGIPMGIDPAPFWVYLFLHHYEEKFVKKLVSSGSPRAYKYHGTSRFIDDLCAINDGDDFMASYKEIYPKELELKVEHHGNHAIFLDLDITIKANIF